MTLPQIEHFLVKKMYNQRDEEIKSVVGQNHPNSSLQRMSIHGGILPRWIAY